MAEQPELPLIYPEGVGKTQRFAAPVDELKTGAENWARRMGNTHNAEQFANIGRVGRGYNALYPVVRQQVEKEEPLTPEMQRSYEVLRSHVKQQYDYLTSPKEKGGLGYSVEVTKENPYETPHQLREDVAANRRLRVLSTESTGGHGIWSNEENDMFRAVHDAFGHLATGRNFAREGEEAAYASHASMFPKEALPALVSETRAQNAYLINAKEFPPNRPFNVPEWATSLEGAPEKPKKKKQTNQPGLFD